MEEKKRERYFTNNQIPMINRGAKFMNAVFKQVRNKNFSESLEPENSCYWIDGQFIIGEFELLYKLLKDQGFTKDDFLKHGAIINNGRRYYESSKKRDYLERIGYKKEFGIYPIVFENEFFD